MYMYLGKLLDIVVVVVTHEIVHKHFYCTACCENVL